MNLKVAVVGVVALGSLIYCGYKNIKAKKALDELINRYKKNGMPEETPEVIEPQEEVKEEQQEAIEATAEESTINESTTTTDEKTEEQSK